MVIVDIKAIYYGEPMTAAVTGSTVKAFIEDTANTKQVTNVHATTWNYTQDEGSSTDYINQLDEETYYNDSQLGSKNISFSIGEYTFEQKADFQGGTATSNSWAAPTNKSVIYKGVVAVTKDETYIVFPKGKITATTGMIEDKVIGLMVKVVPVSPGVQGVSTEYQFSKDAIV